MAKVLITGASGGIGYELAKVFAREKYDLLLVARDEERLKEIKKEFEDVYHIGVQYLSKDLSQKTSVEEVSEWVEKQGAKIDILINNAGVGQYGAFKDIDIQKEENMIALNITALTKLSKYVLKFMKTGHILNVASTAAFEPGPYMAVYFATKAYVLSYSEALAEELRGTGIHVSTLCPGPTKTGFEKAADAGSAAIFKSTMSAEVVAKYAYRKMLQNKRIIIPGAQNKALVFFTRLIPRALLARIMGIIMKS
ncbi:MAG: SDR family NAD(P)-dependent oxidoreductase [Candidatus Gracilibacteria bacterium]